MRISPRLLCFQDTNSNTPFLQFFEDTRIVRTADLSKIDREITWHEAFALAVRGEIEGVAVSSGRIKYFRVLGPDERPDKLETSENGTPEKTPAAKIDNQAQKLHYRESGESGWSRIVLKRYVNRQWVRWSDRDGFNPSRFNPDRIPAPLRAR
jgi:hypothetical protein